MKRLVPRFALGMVVVVYPACAYADDPAAAEALFKEALAKYKEGDYAGACPKFAESQALDPRPGTLFAMAECEAAGDHIATAATLYEDFLRTVAGIKNPTQQAKYATRVTIAQTRRGELLPDVPRLTLVLPLGSPSDVRITRNGEPVATALLGAELPVNPGEHLITVQSTRGPAKEQRITLGHKDKQTVVLQVVETPPSVVAEIVPYLEPKPSQVRTSEPSQSLRTAGFVVGGVGVGGLIMGIVAGGMILQQKPIIEGNCPNDLCNATGMAAVNRLPALDVTNALGLALGGIATVSAAIIIGVGSRAPTKKQGKAEVHWQAFVGGPKDVMVGVKGAF